MIRHSIVDPPWGAGDTPSPLLWELRKTFTVVYRVNLTLILTFPKGWGFCHKVCQEEYDIFQHKLTKVQLTILSDKLCKEIGTVEADNLGLAQVVNTRKELCGAFVNEMNVTFANYTLRIFKKKNSERLHFLLRNICN